MKKFRFVAFLILFLSATLSVVAQDKIKVSISYVNTEFKVNPAEAVDNLGGLQAEADAKIFTKGKVRFSGVFTYQRAYDETLAYYEETMDLVQRDVDSYGVGGRLTFQTGPVDLFGGFSIGVRDYNESGVKRQFFRRWDAGVDIPFHKESNFFIRPFFVQAELVGGLAQDPRFKYGAGGGFRF